MKSKSLAPKIRNFFHQFDISDTEIDIYLELLQQSNLTIAKLVSKTKIPRTTIYGNIDKLIHKGLVTQAKKDSRRFLMAEKPEKLRLLLLDKKLEVEEEVQKIQELENNIEAVVDEVVEVAPAIESASHINAQYYEGKAEVNSIYHQAFLANELRSYVNLGKVHIVFPENNELYMKVQKEMNSKKVKEIIDDSKESISKAKEFSQSPNFEYRVKSLPSNKEAIDVLIFDGRVAMVNFEASIIGSVLTNKPYYEHSKALFDFLWDSLPVLNSPQR